MLLILGNNTEYISHLHFLQLATFSKPVIENYSFYKVQQYHAISQKLYSFHTTHGSSYLHKKTENEPL
jgi:hypothetical protein